MHFTLLSLTIISFLSSFHFILHFNLICILTSFSFYVGVVGVLLGMAYKAGVSCRLDLPLIIQQILYSTSSSPPPLSSSPSSISLPGKSKVAQRHQMKIKSDLFLDDFLCSAGWCLRLGITSIYPEVMRHFECLLFTCLRTNVTFLFILQLRIHF